MIDQQTIDKIMDAANILEVVSDFVTLRRRGVNYVGLCPFHNEKTPSFSVSPSKGICKCFSCGKGGTAVHFIMEHEQMSYYEALKYLAKKYGIAIEERELSDEEKQIRSERESMLIVNSYAQEYFSKTLFEHAEGKSVGLSYFHERGFRDDIIRKFGLGYSLEQRDALAQSAIRNGYKADYLLKTGLCLQGQNNQLYDRFKGRVIFPVYSLSGKVLAFGGRVLKKTEKSAKYVNSPESDIYHKSTELYGIYHAKQAIVKQDSCFLVEGYTDVLSMHQAGIENVVASSGTSLTPGQIRLIHRFTDNITVLYDGDAAGIKASLRGIDLILQEGMNIKVVLLPDGDDPDSFSKKQSAASFTEYIKSHETDFIRFKTKLLLDSAGDDPIKRAGLISDIVRTISVIPDNIIRSVYIQECSRQMEIEESILLAEVNKMRKNQSEANLKNIANPPGPTTAPPDTLVPPSDPGTAESTPATDSPVPPPSLSDIPPTEEELAQIPVAPIHIAAKTSPLYRYEKNLLQYVVRYGYCDLFELEDEQHQMRMYKVIDYIMEELKVDEITFSHPLYRKMMELAIEQRAHVAQAIEQKQKEMEAEQNEKLNRIIAQIRENGQSLAEKEKAEQVAAQEIRQESQARLAEVESRYLERYFVSHPDNGISQLAVDLVTDKYQLSKVHTKFQHVETEREKLPTLIPRALYELKDAIISQHIKAVRDQMRHASSNDEVMSLMAENNRLYEVKSTLAKYIGERIVTPSIK